MNFVRALLGVSVVVAAGGCILFVEPGRACSADGDCSSGHCDLADGVCVVREASGSSASASSSGSGAASSSGSGSSGSSSGSSGSGNTASSSSGSSSGSSGSSGGTGSTGSVHAIAFEPQRDYAAGTMPGFVRAVDLDGDGNLDLVVADRGNGTGGSAVAALYGYGDGGFTVPFSQPSVVGTYMLDARGADGGGPSTIVVGGSGAIQIFEARPSQTFVDAGVYPSPDNPQALFRAVAIADLYNDGGSEAVIGDIWNQDVRVFELGALSFGSRSWGVPTPRGVAVGPLVEAGRNDFVATHDGDDAGSSGIFIYEDPLGVGGARTYPVGRDPKWVTLGDLNGDGLLDIVTCDNNGNTLQIYMNSGGGFFAIGQTVGEPSPYQAVVADMNGDGIQDLVTVDPDFTIFGAAIHLGFGDGGLHTTPITADDQNGNRGQQSLDVADFNHDGLLDIAIADVESGKITVWLAR